MDSFTLVKLLTTLVLPPVSMMVGLTIGAILILVRLRRLGWLVMILSVGELAVLSLAPVSDRLMMALEDQARMESRAAPHCCYDAIVVLGGGVEPATSRKGFRFHLSGSADRVVEGAYLFGKGLARHIIVSGNGGEAGAMQQFLIALGVPAEAIVVDAGARNTLETIENVRSLVADRRVAFVTSAYHMPRVLQLARRTRMSAAAFPTDFQGPAKEGALWATTWIPSLGNLNEATVALHEIIALALDYRQPHWAPGRPEPRRVSSSLRPALTGGHPVGRPAARHAELLWSDAN